MKKKTTFLKIARQVARNVKKYIFRYKFEDKQNKYYDKKNYR